LRTLTLIIFAVTYSGIALGRIPGLAMDRTGIALLGAIAMVATGILAMPEALHAVDMPTILLLYGLMIVSAQLRLGGFYTWSALRISGVVHRPRLFLMVLMLASGVLSAALVNDIVCLAFTPVIAVAVRGAGMNPLPFLLGLAVSSNIGSAATIIGNPQNMLIGQVGGLDFGRFLLWCAPPSFLALAAGYGVIAWLYRDSFHATPARVAFERHAEWPDLNRHQSVKGIIAVVALLALFFTRIPRELTAIGIAGALLCSRRMHTRSILGLVDWHLITLFCGLFIVIRGIETTNLPQATLDWLAGAGFDVRNLYVLTGVSAALSNLVSNVPAAMVLVKFLDTAAPTQWYALALSSTFAGNFITIGSIANLIVIEQARAQGIEIGFREHARTGIPVTILSLLITLVW
jgi:Na+/H+ antiporter NhaD/arsenite permease-like protein